ncbi:hypothetical protein F4824DRAFT_97455 [Ustulina deusta]|nr:hypothetical protein F4823DRAFT_445477 [Ustulina deusta]KAI3338062.1 hypothetical protein F4824DRAFT_97455 [Ustulina deusta]
MLYNDPIPATLVVHNDMLTGEGREGVGLLMLEEKIGEAIAAAGATAPHALIVDGLDSAYFSTDDDVDEVLWRFASTFSGLTVQVERPAEARKLRYLSRGRSGERSETFDARMRA